MIRKKSGKFSTIVLFLFLFIFCEASASTEQEIKVNLNGNKIYFDQQPVIKEGRTLVPMRAIFEAMDCEVEWDGEERAIAVFLNDKNIMSMWVDNPEMWTADKGYVKLDVPPQIINGRTLVPVRAISESIGAEVNWNGSTRTVSITYNFKYTDYEEICTHPERAVEETKEEKIVQTEDEKFHQLITTTEKYCTECKEELDSRVDTIKEEHCFENGVCECGKVEMVISADPGNLDVEDDGSYKVLHLQCGESFMVTNRTKSAYSIKIVQNESERYHYVSYDENGNVTSTKYNQKIYANEVISIKAGYTMGIYNPNEFTIEIKAPSAVFYPEDIDSFETIKISSQNGIYLENSEKSAFSINIVQNESERYHYVSYDENGNVTSTKYNQKIYANEVISIKAGYTTGIYNLNTSDMVVVKPTAAGNYSNAVIYDIISISAGENYKIDNNIRSAFGILIRGTEDANRYDFISYDDGGNVTSTKYNQKIDANEVMNIKAGHSLSISNSSEGTVYIYIPKVVEQSK